MGVPANGASSKGWGAESTFSGSFCNRLRISAAFSLAQELLSPKSHCCENRAGTELPLKLPAGVSGIPGPCNPAPPGQHSENGHARVSRSDDSQKTCLKTCTERVSVWYDVFLECLPWERQIPAARSRVRLRGCQCNSDVLGIARRSRNPVSGSCPGLCTENHAWLFTAASNGFQLFNVNIGRGLILAAPHALASNFFVEMMTSPMCLSRKRRNGRKSKEMDGFKRCT